jgi:hypothetical protein
MLNNLKMHRVRCIVFLRKTAIDGGFVGFFGFGSEILSFIHKNEKEDHFDRLRRRHACILVVCIFQCD